MESFTKAKALRCCKKFFLLILLLSAGLCAGTGVCFAAENKTSNDAYESLFLYAQTLHNNGAFEQAQVEYKRYIFMQDYSRGIHQTQAFENLAALYAQNNEWELAAQTQYKAILSSLEDEDSAEKTDLLRQKHIFYLAQQAKAQNFSFQENLFIFSYLNLPEFSSDVKETAAFYSFKNLIETARWETAQTEFNLFTAAYPQAFTAEEYSIIQENLNNIITFKPKKLEAARYLSLFPGLGQLYAANYKDSLNAFLLNGSLIAVSVYSICTLDLWTFSLLEFEPLLRFMKGNIYNAQKDAHEYNTRHINAYTKEIMDLLDLH